MSLLAEVEYLQTVSCDAVVVESCNEAFCFPKNSRKA